VTPFLGGLSLEAMLFVAAQIETAERSQKLQNLFGDTLHMNSKAAPGPWTKPLAR